MIVSLAHEPSFSLGPLHILPATREIVHEDGQRSVVEPRVMQMLIALVRADGAIVTREALIESCWEGRIVGEDAINRVVSRLRSTAGGIGAGLFRIETVTRIGYRLVRLEPADEAEPGGPAPTPSPFISTVPNRISWALVTAMALAALLVVSRPWWTGYPDGGAAARPRAQLYIMPFVPGSPNLPSGMVRGARDEVVAAFAQTGFVDIVTAPARDEDGTLAWKLSGSIDRDSSKLRFLLQLTHESAGKIVWSAEIARPADDGGAAIKSMAASVQEVIAESLSAAASYRGGTLPDSTMALMLQFNQDTTLPVGPYYHAEEELRRAVAQTPDFGAGWSTLALALGYTATASDDPAAMAAARAEAPPVIAKALFYRPGDALALLARAKIVPPSDFLDRDAAYRAAIAAPQSDMAVSIPPMRYF